MINITTTYIASSPSLPFFISLFIHSRITSKFQSQLVIYHGFYLLLKISEYNCSISFWSVDVYALQ